MQKREYPFPVMYHLFKQHRTAFSKLIQSNCCCAKSEAKKNEDKQITFNVDEAEKTLWVQPPSNKETHTMSAPQGALCVCTPGQNLAS